MKVVVVASKNQESGFVLARLDSQIVWSKDIPLDEFFTHEFNPSARTVTLKYEQYCN